MLVDHGEVIATQETSAGQVRVELADGHIQARGFIQIVMRKDTPIKLGHFREARLYSSDGETLLDPGMYLLDGRLERIQSLVSGRAAGALSPRSSSKKRSSSR